MGRQYQPNVQLRNARLLRNWTYKETARELNLLMLSRGETQAAVTLQMVYRWERGEVRPSMFYRRYFCLLYGMRPDELGFLPEEFSPGEESVPAVASDSPQRRKPLANEPTQPSPSETSRLTGLPSGSEDDLEALNVTRRQLLAASGLLGAAVSAETATEVLGRVAEPLEHVARVASGRAAADDELITDLSAITSGLGRASTRVPASLLVESVRVHIDLVTSVLERPMLPGQREALLCIASWATSLMSTLQFFDLGDRSEARHWLVESIRLGEATDNADMHVLGLRQAAKQSTYLGQGARSVQLLESARRLAMRKCSPNAQSQVLADLAEAHATLHQPRDVPELLELAATAQQRSQPGYEPSWIAHWSRANVAGYTGAVHMRLQQPGPARVALHEALAAAPPSAVKRRSIYLIDLAITYAQDFEIEKACELAGKALELAGSVHHGATLERIGGLRRRLAPWQTDRAVKDLDERLRAVGAAAS